MVVYLMIFLQLRNRQARQPPRLPVLCGFCNICIIVSRFDTLTDVKELPDYLTELIMHQYSTIRNIIGMKVLNFKVVYGYRAFQQFMLYLLNDDILFPYLSATGL